MRVIHLSRDTLFWFDVHADKPGVISSSTAAVSRVAQPLTSVQTPLQMGSATSFESTAKESDTIGEPPLGESLEASDGMLLQRVKAWNTVHHPVPLVGYQLQ